MSGMWFEEIEMPSSNIIMCSIADCGAGASAAVHVNRRSVYLRLDHVTRGFAHDCYCWEHAHEVLDQWWSRAAMEEAARAVSSSAPPESR